MSIDKSTMKIFFEAMEGTMLGSGYSSKIVTTPMGPFKWNSTTELWENVNNGMVMNNISFQDMMFMGYETNSGDNGNSVTPDVTPILTNTFGNITGMTLGATIRWASVSGPQTNVLNGSTVAFSDIDTVITLRTSAVQIQGTGQSVQSTYYSINGGPGITATISGFTIANGQVLRIGVKTPNDLGSAAGATGNISLLNLSNNSNILASITWSYKYPLIPG
jgi:hypothetical protein